MDWKVMSVVFAQVFVAELGDKTQLTTISVTASNPAAKWAVFAGAASALVLSSAIGVFAGQAITAVVGEKALRWLAGLGFLAMGVWTLLER